jgi:hypothetical protein
MRARFYVLLWLATAVLGTAVIAALNHANPDRPAALDRHNQLEWKIAQRIAAGHPVVLVGRPNEWWLRWAIARQLPAAPDVVVLGSSHSLGVTRAMLGRRTSMNFSISGSALSDHFVTAGILRNRGFHPHTWVIFVDPWLFDRSADLGAWQDSQADLLGFERLLRLRVKPPLEPTFEPAPSAESAPVGRAYSLDPLVHHLDSGLNEIFRQPVLAPEGDFDATVLAADGSIRSSADRRPAASDDITQLALRQFGRSPDRHRYGNYENIDETLWRYFEQWVFDCRAQGGVWLVLPPYHPAIYGDITDLPQNQLRRIEGRLRALGRRSGIRVLGSFDPVIAGISDQDFADGDHLRATGLQRLLAPLTESLSRPPGPPAP